MEIVSPIIEFLATYVEGFLCVLFANALLTGKRADKKELIKFGVCIFGFSVIILMCNQLALVSQWTILMSLSLYSIILWILFKKELIYCILTSITYLMLMLISEMFFLCAVSLIVNDVNFVFEVITVSSRARIFFIFFVKSINIFIYIIFRNKIRNMNYSILGNPIYIISAILGFILVLNMMSIISGHTIKYLQLGIAILFVAFLIILFLVIYLLNKLFNNQLKLEQKMYVDLKNGILEKSLTDINRLYEENSKSFHDFKHHITAMEVMLENKQYDKMEEYIKEISIVNKYSPKYFTGNEIVDMVLNVKSGEMEQKGIEFKADVECGVALKISNSDMCSLLANLIDNAIEASVKTESKKVKLKIKEKGDMVVISVSNSCIKNPIEDSFKSDKVGNHGWGTKIIRDIAERYHGYVSEDYEENVFIMRVMLVE